MKQAWAVEEEDGFKLGPFPTPEEAESFRSHHASRLDAAATVVEVLIDDDVPWMP